MAPKNIPRLHPFFYGCCRLLAQLIFRVACRVHVVVLEKPPVKGPLIMASNHISHFEPALLSAFFPRSLDWLAMEELFHHPWSARFFTWLNVISIDRTGKKSSSNRQALKEMKARLSARRALGIFPEGGIRSGTASILEGAPLKPGVATLSILTQTPIIPCVVLGTDRLYSRKAWLQRPHLWIIIGKAIIPPLVITAKHNENSILAKAEIHANSLLQQQLSTAFPALQQELCNRFQLRDDDLPKMALERIEEARRSQV